MIKTKTEFTRYFRAEILPIIRERYEADGMRDLPARREAWNDTIDAMVKDRQLPRCAVDWVCPDSIA
jgi:hypothetical protein